MQAEVEKAFSVVGDEVISIVCAGRTDTGVHGTNQIVHLIPAQKDLLGNGFLG